MVCLRWWCAFVTWGMWRASKLVGVCCVNGAGGGVPEVQRQQAESRHKVCPICYADGLLAIGRCDQVWSTGVINDIEHSKSQGHL